MCRIYTAIIPTIPTFTYLQAIPLPLDGFLETFHCKTEYRVFLTLQRKPSLTLPTFSCRSSGWKQQIKHHDTNKSQVSNQTNPGSYSCTSRALKATGGGEFQQFWDKCKELLHATEYQQGIKFCR